MSYYLTTPDGQVIPVSAQQAAQYSPFGQTPQAPAEPAPIEIPETAIVKCFRLEPRSAKGFYGTFPATEINQVEGSTVERWGRGRWEWQVWDGAKKITAWSAELAGRPPTDAEGKQIDELAEPDAAMMAPDATTMREARWPGMDQNVFYQDQIRNLGAQVTRLERENGELRELNRRLEMERSELKGELSRAEERAQVQKLVGELQARAELAKKGENDGLMATLLPTLLEKAFNPVKGSGSDFDIQLDRLVKLRELTDTGGESSTALEVIKALPAVAEKLAPQLAPPVPAQAAQNGQAAAAQQQQQAPAAYTTPEFVELLTTGLEKMWDGALLTKWVSGAERHITDEGKQALSQIGDDGSGLIEWAYHIPGIKPRALQAALVGNQARQQWIMKAFTTLKQRMAA